MKRFIGLEEEKNWWNLGLAFGSTTIGAVNIGLTSDWVVNISQIKKGKYFIRFSKWNRSFFEVVEKENRATKRKILETY